MNERILDDNGNFVNIASRPKVDPRDKEIALLKVTVDNLKASRKLASEEILSLKGLLAEANPTLKQEIENLKKKVFGLVESSATKDNEHTAKIKKLEDQVTYLKANPVAKSKTKNK